VRRALAVHELQLRRSRRRAGGYAVVTGQNRPVFPSADQRDATLDEVEVYAWRLSHQGPASTTTKLAPTSLLASSVSRQRVISTSSPASFHDGVGATENGRR